MKKTFLKTFLNISMVWNLIDCYLVQKTYSISAVYHNLNISKIFLQYIKVQSSLFQIYLLFCLCAKMFWKAEGIPPVFLIYTKRSIQCLFISYTTNNLVILNKDFMYVMWLSNIWSSLHVSDDHKECTMFHALMHAIFVSFR